MAIDIYSPVWMEGVVRELPVQYAFFKDRYFGEAPILFNQEKVLVDYDDGEGNILAPFVEPRVGDVPLTRDGYETYELVPPYVAPSLPLSIDNLLTRQAGESIISTMTPEQREKQFLVNDLATLDRTISRREEWICVNTMLDNACTMTHIGTNGEKGKDLVVKYYTDENPGVFSPSEAWESGTSELIPGTWYKDICKQLANMRAANRNATDLIVGTDVAELILEDAWAWKMLDIRRANLGELDPRWGAAGVTRIGKLNFGGQDLEIFCYQGTYQTRDIKTRALTTENYFPTTGAMLAAPNTGVMRYGAVTQMEQDRQFHTRTGIRVPKYVADINHNERSTILTSRPLAAPKLKGAWRSCRDVFTVAESDTDTETETEEETA